MRYLALIAVVFASGCSMVPATPWTVKSNVVVFHKLAHTDTPTKYAFAQLSDDPRASSLEYQSYEDRIRTQLNKHNFVETPPDEAEVFVTFDYFIGPGKERRASVPVMGQTGTLSSHTTGTIDPTTGMFSGTTHHTPTYGVVGSQSVSSTVYDRRFLLLILEPPVGQTLQDSKIVYQADVLSVGTSGQIARVMPNIIDALFEEFPGQSGSTRTEQSLMQ